MASEVWGWVEEEDPVLAAQAARDAAALRQRQAATTRPPMAMEPRQTAEGFPFFQAVDEPAEALAAAEAAALRQKQAVRPSRGVDLLAHGPGGGALGQRQEGPITQKLEGIGTGLYHAGTAPKRFMEASQARMEQDFPGSFLPSGGVLSTDVQDPRRAAAEVGAETAFNLMGLPALTGGVPAGVGIFGGRLAKTADQGKLARAKEMADQGLGRREIFDVTGWFQGMDGKWRFEIPDNLSSVSPVGVERVRVGKPTTMSGLLSHDALWAAYPDLAKVAVNRDVPEMITASGGQGRAGGVSHGGRVGIAPGVLERPEQTRSIALHELQHEIQRPEGFMVGSAPKPVPPLGVIEQEYNYFDDAHTLLTLAQRKTGVATIEDLAKLPVQQYREALSEAGDEFRKLMGRQHETGGALHALRSDPDRASAIKWVTDVYNDMSAKIAEYPALQKKAFDDYWKQASEVEARNVQDRMTMTPEQRRARPPWDTQDVASWHQTVDFGSLSGGRAPDPTLGANAADKRVAGAALAANQDRPRAASVVEQKRNDYTGQRDVKVLDAEGNTLGWHSGTRKTDKEIIEGWGQPEPRKRRPPTRPDPLVMRDAPEGRAPDVDWSATDLQDRGTKQSIMESFGRGSGVLRKAYVDLSALPKEKLAGGRSGYDWEQFGWKGGGAPPPPKVRINKNGSVSILDGNHRIAYWREQGFDEVPVYIVDERVKPPKSDDAFLAANSSDRRAAAATLAASQDQRRLDFAEFVARNEREISSIKDQLGDFDARPRYELVKGDQRVMASKTISGDSPYRITSFDKQGPSGHFDVRDLDELARELRGYARQGYTKPGGGPVFGANATDRRAAAGVLAANQEQPLSLSPSGIRAYHGSPYDFERFDMSKIGTGEGAQAYGHGLYFAENPSVAQTYRDMLAKYQWDDAKAVGELLPSTYRGSHDGARKIMDDVRGALLSGEIKNAGDYLKVYDVLPEFAPAYKRAAELIGNKGRMYEVNINAKPEQMLDWDAPLSAQSDRVRPIVENSEAGMYIDPETFRKRGVPGVQGQVATGSDLYHSLPWPKPEITNALRDAGIPGIRYLDQQSRPYGGIDADAYRTAMANVRARIAEFERGGGPDRTATIAKLKKTLASQQKVLDSLSGLTHNYVMFDDKLIDILRKYAIPGAVGAGGFGSLAVEDEQ